MRGRAEDRSETSRGMKGKMEGRHRNVRPHSDLSDPITSGKL